MFKKLNIKKILKETFILALTLFLAMNILSYIRSPELSSSQLPNISKSLIDNTHFSTSEFSDKPILIHFWAIWCPTCKLEAGNIQTISEHFNVITIAVKSGTNAQIQKYLSENDFNFKVINDNNAILSSQFSVPAYPTTFIYNSKGKLEFSEVGYSSLLGLYLRMLWAK